MNVEHELRTAIRDVTGRIEPTERAWDFVERRRHRRRRRRASLAGSAVVIAVLGVGVGIATRNDTATVAVGEAGPESLPSNPPTLAGRVSGILVDDPRCGVPSCPLTKAAELDLASLQVRPASVDEGVVDVAPAPGGDTYVHALRDQPPGVSDRTTLARVTPEGEQSALLASRAVASSTIGVSRSGKVAWVERDEGSASVFVFDPKTATTTRLLTDDARLASPTFGPGDAVAVLRTTDDDPSALQHAAELAIIGADGSVETVPLPDDLPSGFEDEEPRISWGSRGLLAVTRSRGLDGRVDRTVVVDMRDGTVVAEFDGWYGQAWAPDGTGLLLFRPRPVDDGSDSTTVSSTDGAVGLSGTLNADPPPPPPGPRGTTEIALAYGPDLSRHLDVGVVDHYFAGTHWVGDARVAEPGAPRGDDRSAFGDLDGDGRPDRFVVTGERRFTMRAELATGQVVEALADEATFNVIGAVDVNGDGRDEVVVQTGGETVMSGGIVVLHDGVLRFALTRDQGPFPTLVWYAHSLCCAEGTADVACLPVDGEPAVVVASSQLVPKGTRRDGPLPRRDEIESMPRDALDRVWDRTIFRLEGATMVEVSSDEGRFPADEEPPDNLPLDNALRCGPLTA